MLKKELQDYLNAKDKNLLLIRHDYLDFNLNQFLSDLVYDHPIYIDLGEDKSQLEKQMDNLQLKISSQLEQGKSLLILDNYDAKLNLSFFQSLGLTAHPRLKIIIVSKAAFLELEGPHKTYSEQIIPEGFLSRGLKQLQEITIPLLTTDEIYHRVEISISQESHWKVEYYRDLFDSLPELMDLAKYPRLLELMVTHVPKSLGLPKENHKRSDGYRLCEYLLVQWFSLSIDRLERSGQLVVSRSETEKDSWEFAEAVAGCLHEDGRHDEVIEIGDRWNPLLNGEWCVDRESGWKRLKVAKQVCPWVVVGEGKLKFLSGFVQKILYKKKQSKYAAHIGRENRLLADNMSLLDKDDDTTLEKVALNQEIIVGDSMAIQLEVDILNKDPERRLKQLKSLVDLSRKGERYAIGAVNAITILNAANTSFTGWNLSGVTLSAFDEMTNRKIGADLNGAIFCDTNLEDASLENVNLSASYLVRSNFNRAILRNVNFGQFPMLIHNGEISVCIFSSDDKWLIVGDFYGRTYLYSTITWDCVRTLNSHDARINTLAYFSQDGLVVSSADDGIMHIWDVNSGQKLYSLKHHCGEVINLVSFKDKLISFSNFAICFWDVNTGTNILTRETDDSHFITSAALSTDGLLATASVYDRNIYIWNTNPVEGRLQRWLFAENVVEVSCLIFSKNDLLAYCNFDRYRDYYAINVWSANTKTLLITFKGHDKSITGLTFISENFLASCSRDRTVCVWDIDKGAKIATFNGHTDWATCICSTGNGILASGGLDKTVHLWRSYEGMKRKQTPIPSSALTEIGFSPELLQGFNQLKKETIQAYTSDGKLIAKSSQGRFRRNEIIYLYNVKPEILLGTLIGHSMDVTSLAFSNHGLLASASQDCTICLWDTNIFSLVKTIKGHTDWVTCVVFIDEELLISGSRDCKIRIWNINNSECVAFMPTPDGTVVKNLLFMKSSIIFSTLSSGAIGAWKLLRSDNTLSLQLIWSTQSVNLTISGMSFENSIELSNTNRQLLKQLNIFVMTGKMGANIGIEEKIIKHQFVDQSILKLLDQLKDEVLSPKEAEIYAQSIQFHTETHVKLEVEQIKSILEIIGYHSVSIFLSLLLMKRKYKNIDNYLTRFCQRKIDLFEIHCLNLSENENIKIVLSLLFDTLNVYSIELLSYIILLNSDFISIALLKGLMNSNNYTEIIKELELYALIYKINEICYRINLTLLQYIRLYLPRNETSILRMVTVFSQLKFKPKELKSNEISAEEILPTLIDLAQLAEGVECIKGNEINLLLLSDLYLRIGTCFGYISENELLIYLEKALRIQKQAYGENHWKVAKTMGYIGATYIEMDDFLTAKNKLKTAIDLLRDQNEANSKLKYFEFAVNYTIACIKIGASQEELEFTDKIVDELQVYIDNDDNDFGPILLNLGINYLFCSKIEKAEIILIRAKQIIVKNYELLSQTLGLASMHLGIAYLELGKLYNAEEEFLDARKSLEGSNVQGKNNFALITLYRKLGIVYMEEKEFDSAKTMLQNALNLQRTLYDEFDIQNIDTIDLLVDVYIALSEFKLALTFLKRIVEFESHYNMSKYSPSTMTLVQLGRVYTGLGNYEQAINFLLKAEELCRPNLMENVEVLACLGRAYFKSGESGMLEGHVFLFQAINIIERLCDQKNGRLYEILENISDIYLEYGLVYKARKTLERILKRLTILFGEEDISFDKIQIKLAMLYFNSKMMTETIVILNRVLRHREKEFGEDDASLIVLLINLGRASVILSDLYTAKRLFNRALSIGSKFNFEVMDRPEVHLDVAVLEEEMVNTVTARVHAEQAFKMFYFQYGLDSDLTKHALDLLLRLDVLPEVPEGDLDRYSRIVSGRVELAMKSLREKAEIAHQQQNKIKSNFFIARLNRLGSTPMPGYPVFVRSLSPTVKPRAFKGERLISGSDSTGTKHTTEFHRYRTIVNPSMLNWLFWAKIRSTHLREFDTYVYDLNNTGCLREQINIIIKISHLCAAHEDLISSILLTQCRQFLLRLNADIDDPVDYYTRILKTQEKAFLDQLPVEMRYPMSGNPNNAVIDFLVSALGQNHRDLDVDYNPNLMPILIGADDLLPRSDDLVSKAIEYIIYSAPSYTSNKNEIAYDVHLTKLFEYIDKKKQLAIMLSIMPDNTRKNFMVSILYNGILFIINPKGCHFHSDMFPVLLELENKKIISKLFIYDSNQPLQHDIGIEISSSGPICVEIIRILSQDTNLFNKLRELDANIFEDETTRLKFYKFDFNSLFSNTVLENLEKLDTADYERKIYKLRHSHCELLGELHQLQVDYLRNQASNKELIDLINLYVDQCLLEYHPSL